VGSRHPVIARSHEAIQASKGLEPFEPRDRFAAARIALMATSAERKLL